MLSNITVSWSYKASHFKSLSQLKLLGEFAKIWFGKNFPVAVISQNILKIETRNSNISLFLSGNISRKLPK